MEVVLDKCIYVNTKNRWNMNPYKISGSKNEPNIIFFQAEIVADKTTWHLKSEDM